MMNPQALRQLLEAVIAGQTSLEQAVSSLAPVQVEALGYATVDLQRQQRQGMPEVIFGEGKTGSQILGIARALTAAGQNVLVTRLAPEAAEPLLQGIAGMQYNPVGRTARYEAPGSIVRRELAHPVLVVTAGTSDLPVAEEALETLAAAGIPTTSVVDVGVAGIHRLLKYHQELTLAPAVICVAGMEGALASVVGGLTRAPVVAVPTSVGYGAAFGGVTALCGMLTSCAAGVVVVNIDNGFGAAMAVVRQLSQRDTE